MKHLIYICSFIAILFSSCIENDVPYPVVSVNIESISGEGFTAKINVIDRVITLSLDAETDISKVNITEVVITEGATSSISLIGVFDMNTPIVVTLSLYQDYVWTIMVEQHIDREFIVVGQIGGAEFDVEKKTATVSVYKDADLKNIEVKELQLGPIGITEITPDIIDKLKNFEDDVKVVVKYHNISESWTLRVKRTDEAVKFTKNDVWTAIAWLEAAGDNRKNIGFRYRAEGATEWTTVAKDDLKISGGLFSTKIVGLIPSTKYEFVAYSDSDETPIYSTTTDPATPLVNGGLDDWSKVGRAWYPYAAGGVEYWDSGNKGASTIGANPTTRSEDVHSGSSGIYSAQLASKWLLVKFAGGSLYIGKYLRTIGLNGILAMGQPYTLRPTALKLWVKFKGGKINRVSEDKPPGISIVEGVTDDACLIYIALGTWTPEEYGVSLGGEEPEMFGTEQMPIAVDTRDRSTFFDKDTPAVIAYGEFATSENIEWQQITIPLDYRTHSVVPTHIVIVGASSKYADYFTGCDESILMMDDLELVYD